MPLNLAKRLLAKLQKDSIPMLTTGKPVIPAMNPEVLVKANINQSICRAIHRNESRYLALHVHG